MSTKVPAWARALLMADRAVHSTVRLAALVRTELLLAGLSADEREAVNAAVFSAEDTYAPGGPAFANGLFGWERAALATAPFPAAGRLLLGGAGGGRELAGLAALGYAVDAFEPAPALAEALATVASGLPGARAYQGSYGDLVRAARGDRGPLAAVAGEAYEGVVLGWASLSHVTEAEARRALLTAVRAMAPGAPVLLSYLGPDDDGRANGRVEALRAPLRRTLARVTGGAMVPGAGFGPGHGFYQRFAPGEIEMLADATGYDVALHEREPYPHAMLTPR